jgi:hypothetical protein
MARSSDLPALSNKSAPLGGLGDVATISTRDYASAGQQGTGGAEVYQTAAKVFAQVSGRIGEMADTAAVKEGDVQGGLDGLDPEFRPRGDVSLYSQAYDKAGIEVFKSRMTVDLSSQIGALEDKHATDPKGLDQALLKLRQGWSDKLFDEVRPDFERTFASQRASAVRGASRAWRDERRAEQAGALQEELGTRLRTLHQQSYKLGLDANADDVLAGEMAVLKEKLGMRGVDGKPLVSPDNQRKIIEGAAKETTTARLLGAFERVPGLEGKAQFLKSFEDDFKNSRGLASVYDFGEFQQIGRQLEVEFNRAKTQSEVSFRGLSEQLTSVARRAEDGFAPPAAEMAEIETKVRLSGDAGNAQQLDEAKGVLRWQSWARTKTPAELDQVLLAERERMTKGGATPLDNKILDLGERLQEKMRSEIKADPLGWADRTGVVPVAPLDFSSLETTAASLQARVVTSELVASRYGIEPMYVRPDERRALSASLAQGGQATIAVASAIASAAPDRAPKILAELFDDAPAVAMLGGHVAKAGITAAARDAADGMALRKTDGFKPLAPSATDARTAAMTTFSGALSELPKSETAAVTLANSIYEVRARRAQLTDFDEALWKKGLNEVMGARQVGGETYGGIVLQHQSWHGSSGAVVVPPNVKASGFRDLIDTLRIEDFSLEDRPRTSDIRPVGTADLRRATLKSAGTGKYFLALGDPDGEQPDWLLDSGGDKYVLDLNALEPVLKKRRRDLYLGGR